ESELKRSRLFIGYSGGSGCFRPVSLAHDQSFALFAARHSDGGHCRLSRGDDGHTWPAKPAASRGKAAIRTSGTRPCFPPVAQSEVGQRPCNCYGGDRTCKA